MSGNLASQFLLRKDVVFLNHGSFGACPRPVFETYQAFQRELESQPVDFLGRRLEELMRKPREALAPFLGAKPDDIVGLTNATVALNIVAQSLDLKPGDEILTTDHEYAALEKTWAYVARKTGAHIVVAPVSLPLESEHAFTEDLLAHMSPRTRVLFVSHITSPTALLFPVASIVAEARRRGIWTVIDGAHTPGHIPLDLGALGVDFYAGNCHKWLMTPKGSAFLYVRPELQNLINPLVISHGWTAQSKEPNAKGAFGNSPFIDELEMQGTRDPSALLSIPAALDFRTRHAWNDVARACSRLATETADRVSALTGLPPLADEAFRAPQMVAMPLPECDVEQLQNDMVAHYGIEIPVFKWKAHHIARLSVQGYNTQKDMDALVDALRNVLHLPKEAQAEHG